SGSEERWMDRVQPPPCTRDAGQARVARQRGGLTAAGPRRVRLAGWAGWGESAPTPALSHCFSRHRQGRGRVLKIDAMAEVLRLQQFSSFFGNFRLAAATGPCSGKPRSGAVG